MDNQGVRMPEETGIERYFREKEQDLVRNFLNPNLRRSAKFEYVFYGFCTKHDFGECPSWCVPPDGKENMEIKPVEAIDLLDGQVKLLDLKPGHYVIFVSTHSRIDPNWLSEGRNFLPEGSTGGWIIMVEGNIDDAVRIFRMDQ